MKSQTSESSNDERRAGSHLDVARRIGLLAAAGFIAALIVLFTPARAEASAPGPEGGRATAGARWGSPSASQAMRKSSEQRVSKVAAQAKAERDDHAALHGQAMRKASKQRVSKAAVQSMAERDHLDRQAKPEESKERPSHAALHRRLPRLLSQKTIQANGTEYGGCWLVGQGRASCDKSRQLRELRLPKSFAVDDRHRVVRVNAAAYEAFRQVVEHIDRAGYGPLTRQLETTAERQCRRRSGSWIPNCISNHSWGNAVDVNNADSDLTNFEKVIAPVAAIFESHNFAWGKYFSTNDDPPHFQYASK